ncbi:alpha/beta fold hydrolase [cf. Phormidesmis sp. LEGE 11477]|uniref:alpha/beta fold hydrolase n=1 Tax=cf. Phormidesmis sp. LEGE 11477 TaxID=1828680 RepID=UPI001880A17A|nr:alpha/beta hydrolase [cf. Phormidesmis sp. LEGE 11477]MBE9061645.1 alpha/beta hydrolase [cf. Phormidesmis sp. LEGE 11477]
MLKIPYVDQKSAMTRLGQMVYYIPALPEYPSSHPLSERETLLFLHGFGGGSSAYEWSKVFPAFAGDYRVIAPDLIGWGDSAHLDRNYTIDDYLNSIADFITATCDEPVTVVASALTAALVIRIAIAQPTLFKSLVLMTPAGLSDFGNDYTRSPFAQIVSTPILDKLLYSGVIATPFGIRNFLENRQFADPSRISNDIVEAYLTSAQKPNAEYTALSFVRGDLCFDLADYIAQLTTPTALLWGETASFTGPELGRKLAQKNPTAIKLFEVIKSTGLTPQLELPAVTIGMIQTSLKVLAQEG